ncbi:putative salt tolerance-like protein [Acorus calamus]|uniref:Salt tolerance-like protein n=1 Tax=Acorus calamus TaxID=4465 RepID=A0AAV9CD40_ACOCL|nr:putative salt tolerance-like protein [Acorus calamus]
MKIQCNACMGAEAKVLCVADEAALCAACDEKVHAANKLASKHQRVPLSGGPSSSQMPKCDICQESAGYFFCLEDRALLCRKCDVSIHTANTFVAGHQRFLLTGVKVGMESAQPLVSPPVKEMTTLPGRNEQSPSKSQPKRDLQMPFSNQPIEAPPPHGGKVSGLPANKTLFTGGMMTGNFTEWSLDDLFGLTDFNPNDGFIEHGSSKADSGKLGDSGWSPSYRASDEELDMSDCLGQVPEINWTVPEIPSPPTASGLFWSKNFHNPVADTSVFVPDIYSSSLQNVQRHNSDLLSPKRWMFS